MLDYTAELEAERASAAGEFALTPAGKIVSEAFEKNQRHLAWPVMRGVVTQGFGLQPHPTLKGIKIDNNGIDITTEAGNRVLAIFEGTVSSVFDSLASIFFSGMVDLAGSYNDVHAVRRPGSRSFNFFMFSYRIGCSYSCNNIFSLSIH